MATRGYSAQYLHELFINRALHDRVNAVSRLTDSWAPPSLVPRPFFAGEEKRAWYNLFAHARDSQEKLEIRIGVDIFRVLARSLPLYSRICTTDDG